MRVLIRSMAAALLLPLMSVAASAEDWVVSKATGQVWHATSGAQPVSLAAEARIAPGDLVQTGPSGRVMLTRGAERILVAPNSVISLPKTESPSGFTTILQQAGSIAVEAEKKDHKHFEVLTPYLAAVVKGTQFTVSVVKGAADVNVASGKVEVADVKSGKTALVLPGQFAKVGGPAGLTLGGQGTFEPITQGRPRSGTPAAINIPRQGFSAPPKVEGGLRVDRSNAAPSATAVRIEKALGPISLDAGVATAGLIRSEGAATNVGTIWKPSAAGNPAANANAGSNTNSSANSNANAPGTGNSAGTGPAAATPVGIGVGLITAPGLNGTTPAATGVTPGNASGVNAILASTPAAVVATPNPGVGVNVNGVGVGNAFGLNNGNGIGKAFGLNNGNGIGKALGLGNKP